MPVARPSVPSAFSAPPHSVVLQVLSDEYGASLLRSSHSIEEISREADNTIRQYIKSKKKKSNAIKSSKGIHKVHSLDNVKDRTYSSSFRKQCCSSGSSAKKVLSFILFLFLLFFIFILMRANSKYKVL